MGSQALSTGLDGAFRSLRVQPAGSALAVSAPAMAAPVGMTTTRTLAEIAATLPAASWYAVDAPVEAPLPEPEGERWLEWRPGFGWVERPVEAPEPATNERLAA